MDAGGQQVEPLLVHPRSNAPVPPAHEVPMMDGSADGQRHSHLAGMPCNRVVGGCGESVQGAVDHR